MTQQRSSDQELKADHDDPVVIVEYDQTWPSRFEAERAAIVHAGGDLVIELEHIGSTAVPGLAAKPVIDMQLGVATLGHLDQLASRLAPLGYELQDRGERDGRAYFWRKAGGRRTHLLHVIAAEGFATRDELLFRDWLRAHPDDARAYATLKRDLAARFGAHRVGYMEAKTDFIRAVLARARPGARSDRS